MIKSTLLVLLLSHVPSSTHELKAPTRNYYAELKVAQELANCSMYAAFGATVPALSAEGRGEVEQLVAWFYNESLRRSSYEVTQFNLDWSKSVMSKIVNDNNGNFVPVMKIYNDGCTQLLRDPDYRYDYWNKVNAQ